MPTLGLLVLSVIKMVGFSPIPDDLCSEIYQELPWRSERDWLSQTLLMTKGNSNSPQGLDSGVGSMGGPQVKGKKLLIKRGLLNVCFQPSREARGRTPGGIVLETTKAAS